MKRVLHIGVLLLALWGWAANPAIAGATLPTDVEAGLLALINQARANPLGTAKALGLDPERLLADLPELRHILENGLPPLRWNARLQAAAGAHSADMLANSYYGHESPSGQKTEDRVRAAGYRPFAYGESLGLLGFVNFVGPREAAASIFANMFQDELSPSPASKRNILDPLFREVGVGLSGGAFSWHGSTANVYLASWVFALSDADAAEAALQRKINEIRQNPAFAVKGLGITLGAAREALGEWAEVLDTGLPPLAWDEKLWEAARDHSADMVQRGYYSSVSPEGVGVAERVAAAGYAAETAGEVLDGAEIDAGLGPQGWAETIAETLLIRELSDGPKGFLLNPGVTELAFKLELLSVPTAAGGETSVYLLVADYAKPVKKRSFLVGNAYQDANRNGRPELGEGIKGARVSLRTLDGRWQKAVLTGVLGSFQVELPFGVFLLRLEHEDFVAESLLSGMFANQLLDLRFPTLDPVR